MPNAGNLTATAAVLEAAGQGKAISVTFCNTDSGNETVTVQINRGTGLGAGAFQTMFKFIMATGDFVVINGLRMTQQDQLQALATGAKVNWFTQECPFDIPLTFQQFDQNGGARVAAAA